MKKSELVKIIKEEILNLNEAFPNSVKFKADYDGKKVIVGLYSPHQGFINIDGKEVKLNKKEYNLIRDGLNQIQDK